MDLLSAGTIILGIIIWLLFNKFVTRFYFGTSFLNIIFSIVIEIFVCIIIAGMIVSFLGDVLGPILEALGEVLVSLIKIILVIALIGLILVGVYSIYDKTNGKNFGVDTKTVDGTYNTANLTTHIRMVYCAKCGRQIESTVRFCNYCGYPVSNVDTEPIPNNSDDNLNTSEIKSEVMDSGDNNNSYSQQILLLPQNAKFKFCFKCGQSLESNVRFCSRCGSDQELSGTCIPKEIIMNQNDNADTNEDKTVSNDESKPILNDSEDNVSTSEIKSEVMDSENNDNSNNQQILSSSQNEKLKFCYKCGQTLESGFRFCSRCGSDQELLGTGIQTSIPQEAGINQNVNTDIIEENNASNNSIYIQSINEKKVFCAFCGSSISASVKHCNFCGKPNTYLQQS